LLLTSLIYPKKPIPTSAILFKSIHFRNISTVKPYRPNASSFKDYELSCDWNKYSSAIESRNLISRQHKFGTTVFKNQNEYFICAIHVNENLHLDPVQSFKHDPLYNFPEKIGIPNNRSHSLIIGNKEEKEAVKARKKLADNSKWVVFEALELEYLRTK
jgi:hypothetical protein